MTKPSDYGSIPYTDIPNSIRAIRQQLDLLTGRSGKGVHRALTPDDIDGVGGMKYISARSATGSKGYIEYVTPIIDYPIPPKPTGVFASGNFTNIFVGWDRPAFYGYAHTEVWRSQLDDFGTAFRLLTTMTAFIADPVGYDEGHYYWVRHVNSADATGPIHDTSGVYAQTTINIKAVMEQLSEEIDSSYLAQSLRAPIELIDAPSTGLVDRLAQEIIDRGEAIANESAARAGAVAEESAARAQALVDETTARNSAISAEIQSRIDMGDYLQGQIDGLGEPGGEFNVLSGRITIVEGQLGDVFGDGSNVEIETFAANYDFLESQVNHANTGLSATYNATNALSSRLNSVDGATQSVENLATSFSSLTAEFEDPTTGLIAAHTKSDSALNRISSVDGGGKSIESLASDVDTLESAVNNGSTGLSATRTVANTAVARLDDLGGGQSAESFVQSFEQLEASLGGFRAGNYITKSTFEDQSLGYGEYRWSSWASVAAVPEPHPLGRQYALLTTQRDTYFHPPISENTKGRAFKITGYVHCAGTEVDVRAGYQRTLASNGSNNWPMANVALAGTSGWQYFSVIIPASTTEAVRWVPMFQNAGTNGTHAMATYWTDISFTDVTDETANAEAIEVLDARVTTTEDSITSQANSISSISADITDGSTGLSAAHTKSDGVITRINSVDGGGKTIESLSSDVDTLESTVNHGTTGLSATRTTANAAVTRLNDIGNGQTVEAFVQSYEALEASLVLPLQAVTANSDAIESLTVDVHSNSAASAKVLELESQFGGNTSNAKNYLIGQVDTDLSITSSLNSISSTINNASTGLTSKASITQLDDAIATEESARLSQYNSLDAVISNPSTGLTSKASTSQLSSAITSESQARASDISTLTTTVNGHTSTLSTHASVVDGMDAMWTVNASVGTLRAGFGLRIDQSGSEVFVNAGKFVILNNSGSETNPFIVSGNDVYIASAYIQDASISAAKIQSLNVGQVNGLDANFIQANIGTLYVDNLEGDVNKLYDSAENNSAFDLGYRQFRLVNTLTIPTQTRPRKPILFFRCRLNIPSPAGYTIRTQAITNIDYSGEKARVTPPSSPYAFFWDGSAQWRSPTWYGPNSNDAPSPINSYLSPISVGDWVRVGNLLLEVLGKGVLPGQTQYWYSYLTFGDRYLLAAPTDGKHWVYTSANMPVEYVDLETQYASQPGDIGLTATLPLNTAISTTAKTFYFAVGSTGSGVDHIQSRSLALLSR